MSSISPQLIHRFPTLVFFKFPLNISPFIPYSPHEVSLTSHSPTCQTPQKCHSAIQAAVQQYPTMKTSTHHQALTPIQHSKMSPTPNMAPESTTRFPRRTRSKKVKICYGVGYAIRCGSHSRSSWVFSL